MNITGTISPNQSIETLKTTTVETPRYYVGSDIGFDVIGYTKNLDTHQVYLASFKGPNSEILEKKSFMYLRSILDHEIKNIKKQRDKQNNSLLKTNSVKAATEAVRSFPDINEYVYDGSSIIVRGIINADVILSKTSDSDPDHDYFVVRDNVEIKGENTANPKYAKIDHDIPDDSDHIEDWGPSDSDSESEIQVQVDTKGTVALAYSFPTGGDYIVDEQGSQINDYARWELTDTFWGTWLPNPTRFEPSTSWLSTGTFAFMEIRHWATFEVAGIGTWDGFQHIYVYYDY